MKEITINGVKIKYDRKCVSILESYKIKEPMKMLNTLVLFKLKTGYQSRRSFNSWLKEWVAHNRLYKLGLFRSHTKDCDLEENEKWWRLLAYQFLGI